MKGEGELCLYWPHTLGCSGKRVVRAREAGSSRKVDTGATHDLREPRHTGAFRRPLWCATEEKVTRSPSSQTGECTRVEDEAVHLTVGGESESPSHALSSSLRSSGSSIPKGSPTRTGRRRRTPVRAATPHARARPAWPCLAVLGPLSCSESTTFIRGVSQCGPALCGAGGVGPRALDRLDWARTGVAVVNASVAELMPPVFPRR